MILSLIMPIDEVNSCVAHVKHEFHRVGLHRPTSREASSTPRVKEEILKSSQKTTKRQRPEKRKKWESFEPPSETRWIYTRDEEGEINEQASSSKRVERTFADLKIFSDHYVAGCLSVIRLISELESSFSFFGLVENSLFHSRKSMQVSSYDLTVALV